MLLLACSADSGNQGNAGGGETNTASPAPVNEAAPRPQAEAPAQAPEQSDDVALSATPAQTTENSTMTLTLRNGSEQQIGYNLCASTLETADGRPVPTGRVCTMELRTLEAGRSATYRYELPVNMLEGGYRFVTQVERMGSGGRGGVRSNSFEVTSD